MCEICPKVVREMCGICSKVVREMCEICLKVVREMCFGIDNHLIMGYSLF